MSRRSRSQAFPLRQLDLQRCPTKHEFSQAGSKIVVWLFSSLLHSSSLLRRERCVTSQKRLRRRLPQERIDEKINISRHFCLLLRYASRFLGLQRVKYTKVAKVKLKHRSTLCEVYHICFASQPISRQTVFKSMRFRRLHDQ